MGFQIGVLTHSPRWYAERLLGAFDIPRQFLDGGLQAVREVCCGSEAKATALAPPLQKTQVDKRDEIVPRRLMRNAVGRCVRLEAIASLGITESIAQERELAMIEVGRSLDEFFDVTDLFDLLL